MLRFFFILLVVTLPSLAASRFPEATPDTPANRMIQRYWEYQTAEVHSTGSLDNIKSAHEWTKSVVENRRQLAEMLGLDPMPARTALNPVKTGEVQGEGFVVEKLHFQSSPGLYVTANFYRPNKVEAPLPTILYVCGHSVMKDGTDSLGNKTGYQHHGVWFAQHGYCCLIIDTLQLGEIEGEHHGTHHLDKWWWIARGYTPAGIEAWNGIRALDYLETRPEVDKTRFGVTGRSGGGAYSWWIAALDERIKAAAPTAGITTLKNHVMEGCVEGHCDCMYMVNTYLWDFDRVAALVAPRPLLICNTDKDDIFPLGGVVQLYQSTRRLYTLLGAEAKIGLQIAEGPHKDVQPLNTGAFHWFERHLKGADPMATTEGAAKKVFEPKKLRVFSELPKDQINTTIDHTFVPLAKPAVPAADIAQWQPMRDAWKRELEDKVFRSWPAFASNVQVKKATSQETDGITLTAFDFVSQGPISLRLYIAHREGLRLNDLDLIALNVLDEKGWEQFESVYYSRYGKMFEMVSKTPKDEKAHEQEKAMFATFKWGMAYLAPRGVGPLAWTGSDKAQTQRLRRFYLLGETLASGQVYDIRRSVQALQSITGLEDKKLWISANRDMATNALYASLFEDKVARVDLHDLPMSHSECAPYFNVLKFLDIPQVAAMASEKEKVVIYTDNKASWNYPMQTAANLGWQKNVQLREPQKAE
jgi:dienelactone hydrolase